MIPIASLITPVEPMRPSNTTAFGDMGEFFQSAAEKRRQQDELERHNRAAEEDTRQHHEETNRYYQMQADTHRMEAENHANQEKDREEAKRDQRVSMLRDALRKAKTTGEKRMILDQIANETGGSVEELPMEQAPAAAAQPSDLETAVMGYTPLGAAPTALNTNVSPETKSVLTPAAKKSIAGITPNGFDVGAYMASQGALPMSGEAEGAASPPGEIAPPAQPPQPQGNELAAPPSGSNRYVVKDKSGKVMQLWDEGAESQQNRDAIRKMMEPYIEDATSPEGKAAAMRASTAASDMLSTGQITMQQAVDYAKTQYNKELDRFKKTSMPSRVASGGGGAVPLKQQIALSKFDQDLVAEERRALSRDYNEKAADDMDTFAANAKRKMDLATGTGDYAAFADWLKSESGKVVTDRERAAFEGSAGIVDEIENKMGRWFAGGKFSPEYMGEVRQLMDTIQNGVKEKRAEMARRGEESIRLAGGSPEAQARIRGFYTGDFTVRGGDHSKSLRQPAAPAKGTPRAAAPTGAGGAGDAQNDDERRKAALARMQAALKAAGQ